MIGIIKSKKNVVLSKDYFSNIAFHKFFSLNLFEIPPYIYPKNIKIQQRIKKYNKITIGFLGRISKEKGIENLIILSKNLAKKNIKHEILIAGDISDIRFIKYINKLLIKSKDNKNVKFIGKLKEREKYNFYNKIDVFVLPSVNGFEAFGIVQLEAMSYGVPVIASNINGVRSVIQKTSNGYLFMKNNVNELENKILQIKRKKIFNKKNIIKNTSSIFGKTSFNNKILKLL